MKKKKARTSNTERNPIMMTVPELVSEVRALRAKVTELEQHIFRRDVASAIDELMAEGED